MMSFCKKSVHFLLGGLTIANSADTTTSFDKPPYKYDGLGLITATGETYRPPNVIESSVVKLLPPAPPPPPPLLSLPSMFARKDPGGIGFIDDIGGGVNGLMSCTESLGFESSDERIVDDHQPGLDSRVLESPTRVKWRKEFSERREMKKFPPPLSSFNRNGQPSFFLRSVRADGRLELTEIRVERPEILRASRQDGRLRLHLIRGDDKEHIKHEEEQEEELGQEQTQEEEEEEKEEEDNQFEEEEEEEEEKEEEDNQFEEEEEERVGEWQLPAVSGEVIRRCNDELGRRHHHHHHQNISHHHNLHVWSQHCVPTR